MGAAPLGSPEEQPALHQGEAAVLMWGRASGQSWAPRGEGGCNLGLELGKKFPRESGKGMRSAGPGGGGGRSQTAGGTGRHSAQRRAHKEEGAHGCSSPEGAGKVSRREAPSAGSAPSRLPGRTPCVQADPGPLRAPAGTGSRRPQGASFGT